CAGTANYVDVAVIMLLDGPYDPIIDLMKDDLRSNALIPLSHPFANAPFSHTGTETITSGILADLGADAIVDWVLIELRDDSDPTIIVESRAALLQRDGDVVDLDGTSAVRFNDNAPGSYHVAVRHRNHLGVMPTAPITLGNTATAIDLSDIATATYGTDAQKLRDGK